ncbi:MAG: hypothetical protein HQK54_08275 [Oligoflexales bacterium]|nr:hypothetical protein [Oligoflexales bacterium]
MRITTLMLASLFFFSSCGSRVEEKSNSIHKFISDIPIDYKAVSGYDDLFTVELPDSAIHEGTSPSAVSCRGRIRGALCVLSSMPDTVPYDGKYQCMAGSDTYVRLFEDIHDSYPEAFQKMFCSVKHIFILDRFFATAFAGLIKQPDSDKVIGAQIGIRKSLLDKPMSLAEWASWKEQISFGGNYESYELTQGLPYIQTSSNMPGFDLSYFVVTHEFGHIFDFANQLNRADRKMDKNQKTSEYSDGTWGSISWLSSDLPRPGDRFPYRRSLCFYSCNHEGMTKSAVKELYRGLSGSSFISTYAATSPTEEFADIIAYYMLDKNGYSYILHTGQGESYDVMMKLGSMALAAKRQYITDFLSRTNIAYP